MNIIFYFIVFILLCVSVTYQELTELKQVPRHSFPYVVSIESHEWCHGILITKNYILTNARCVVTSKNIQIHLGWYSYPEDQNRINESDIQTYSSSKVIPHPDYKEIHQYWMYLNDIALVKLKQEVSITVGVKPAKLADPKTFEKKDLAGQYGTVFGWWQVKKLSAATVQIRSQDYCKDIFGQYYLEDRQFCVKWPLGERLCSHHSLPMEIDGKIIGIQQDDPQNNIDCMLYQYKFINILYYYNWIVRNSDLKQYVKINDYIGNTDDDVDYKKLSKNLKTAIESAVSTFAVSGGDDYWKSNVNENLKETASSNTFTTKKKCKIDIALACPDNKEN